jgi:arylsulfatase A-like enzyme
MLVPRIGIVRGFQEEFVKREGKGMGGGTVQVINHLIERLEDPGPGPLFYFTHLIDPHVPYRKHGKKKPKTEYQAYLGEVTFSDRHLGRLMNAVKELGLEDRTVLIVTSDHGEAFGEHGLFTHNKPLYEVMVHVPLFIRIPGATPNAIDAHVSQMDIGPTVLDLFGLPTPGWFMAESLVPLMAGGSRAPHRPIFMERATEVALLFDDGIKVMLRKRPESEEIYDLEHDPDEEHDLREELGEEGDRLVALTRAYAEAHRTKEGTVRYSANKR